jgi:hypothetical protein
VNKIYLRILFLVVLVSSVLVSGNSVKLVSGQTSNMVTNVTDLTKSDLSNADVQLENKTVLIILIRHMDISYFQVNQTLTIVKLIVT